MIPGITALFAFKPYRCADNNIDVPIITTHTFQLWSSIDRPMQGLQMKAKELKRLRKRYVELREQLVCTIQKSEFEVDIAGDAIDKLQGAVLLRVQNQLSKQNLSRLGALERAICKIDLGDYGDCEVCGDTIGIKRLEAIPGVSLCICCAEKAERFR